MAEAKDDIVLSIRGMCKSFGRNRVLDHINLDVKRGTVMGLMGENGAGKSTMMKCLFGTYQKDEGKIFLNGKEISFSGPKDALENGIAMVHQELNQCLERSVIDNLFLGRYPVNSMGVVDEGQMKKKAADLFRKLGMTVNLTQPMRNMSVSQRQMCEIAKAISYNAQVIVLDEPTSSLTVQQFSGQVFQPDVQLLQLVAQPPHGLLCRRIDGLQRRNSIMADTVAGIGIAEIAFVLNIVLPKGGAVCRGITPCQAQKWTAVHAPYRRNTRHAVQAGTARHAEQHRFRLVR